MRGRWTQNNWLYLVQEVDTSLVKGCDEGVGQPL